MFIFFCGLFTFLFGQPKTNQKIQVPFLFVLFTLPCLAFRLAFAPPLKLQRHAGGGRRKQKRTKKFKSHLCFHALCPNARNSMKVVLHSQKTTSAFHEFQSICPFTAYAGPLMTPARAHNPAIGGIRF